MTTEGNPKGAIVSRLRRWLFSVIYCLDTQSPVNRRFNISMLVLISLNVLAVVLETERGLYQRYAIAFHIFDTASVIAFTVEYALRLWVCTLDPRFRSPVMGRIRFALSPLAIIDLLSFLPFYMPLLAIDLRFIRSVRLFRLFRLFKLGRYSQSLKTLARVADAKKEELSVTLFSGAIVLVIASSLMYFVEREAQPEAFSSIPAAMWWGVVTLTTVGYGDIYQDRFGQAHRCVDCHPGSWHVCATGRHYCLGFRIGSPEKSRGAHHLPPLRQGHCCQTNGSR